MTGYFYTRLVQCETYSDFENMISEGCCRLISDTPYGNYYDVSNYCETFKGFDLENFYYPVNVMAGFLYQIIPLNFRDFLDPKFDVKTKTVTFFENLDKRNKGVRSNPTKMGKFFRKIAPFFNDKQIEFLVNYTVSYFAENGYTHHIATSKEITEIYLSKAERGRYLSNYSCINASCMRHDNWDIHPTKVYATESWELHYLTNEDGDIAARALVCKEDDVHSYIYASCEQSGNVLKEKLEELEFTDVNDAHKPFDGAKLLRIKGNGGLVAPYIDYHCDVKDCGEHLEITYSYSDYSFSNTGGYVKCETTYECSCCYNEISEDDVISVDGEPYCDCCTFYCDHFEEFKVGDVFEVFYAKYHSYNVCEDALNDMGAVFNEEENEWQTAEWYEECTKEDEEEDTECKEDTEIENQPKKEIKVGDKCVVTGGYSSFHLVPIGTVVHTKSVHKDTFYCSCGTTGQYIKASDLVVVE